MAEQVIDEINKHIETPQHIFHFNNHRTGEKNTLHSEQKKSATYYAVFKCGIPAFGVETSKSLPLESRIYHHNLSINAFMKIFDIRPEVPGIYIDAPNMRYLVAKVNDQTPVVVANGKTLHISDGDVFRIIHVEANYNRGISADIKGYGSINDINKPFTINRSTRIVVRKDHHQLGEIHLAVNKEKNIQKYAGESRVVFFKARINGEEKYFPNGAHVDIVKGDLLEIADVGIIPEPLSDIIVNFKGFVGNKSANTGEDRGYVIHTDSDLWKRYSLYKKGRVYQIVVTKGGNKIIGRLFVDILEPSFEYVVVQLNESEKICYSPEDTITINYSDTIKLIDIKTNIPKNLNAKIFLSGPGTDVPLDIGSPVVTSKIIPVLNKANKSYKITLRRRTITIGSIPLEIKENRLALKDKN